ncbi:hypothetical protein PIB30_038300 [Stylosanthes scabra]|uniref:Uncharacterized protein n=1 Tax=Stylosanthes scabra TaxID=79078 RepID=A0ABU6SET7_9FABA|nr:hypothetical protein [Stylosanthes scabra]
MVTMLNDAFGVARSVLDEPSYSSEPNGDNAEFYKLLEHGNEELYEGCTNKKWREHRLKLWNEFYDPRLSKTELIKNVPTDIAADQWALYVQYCLKPETQKANIGKKVNRAEMWSITHKKKDRNYVNEQAKEIAEKLKHIALNNR